MRVLVVDDERDVELLFRQQFRREVRSGQIDLTFAFSGEEALDILGESPREVKLVLSDINMPGMNGLELLQRIKESPTPVSVCMMTAYGNDDFRSRAVASGCDGFLVKPLDFLALKEEVRSRMSTGG